MQGRHEQPPNRCSGRGGTSQVQQADDLLRRVLLDIGHGDGIVQHINDEPDDFLQIPAPSVVALTQEHNDSPALRIAALQEHLAGSQLVPDGVLHQSEASSGCCALRAAQVCRAVPERGQKLASLDLMTKGENHVTFQVHLQHVVRICWQLRACTNTTPLTNIASQSTSQPPVHTCIHRQEIARAYACMHAGPQLHGALQQLAIVTRSASSLSGLSTRQRAYQQQGLRPDSKHTSAIWPPGAASDLHARCLRRPSSATWASSCFAVAQRAMVR